MKLLPIISICSAVLLVGCKSLPTEPEKQPQNNISEKKAIKYQWSNRNPPSLSGSESITLHKITPSYQQSLLMISSWRSDNCYSYISFPQVLGALPSHARDILININGQDLIYLPEDRKNDHPRHTFSEKGYKWVMNEFKMKQEITLTYKGKEYLIPTDTFSGALSIAIQKCEEANAKAKILKERKSGAL